MAEIVRIIKKDIRRNRFRFHVDGPVTEALSAADGEDDSIHVIQGNGFDDHGLGAPAPVTVDIALAFWPNWFLIDLKRVLRGQTEEGVCWGIITPVHLSVKFLYLQCIPAVEHGFLQSQRWQLCWQS